MAVWSVTNVIEITNCKRIDSEYFHPNYLKAEEIVLKTNSILSLGKIGEFLIGPFGSAFHVKNYDTNSQYRYIRGKDVKPFLLLNDDNVYMPEKDFERLSSFSVHADDLLISVVGTLGNVAIVPKGVKGIFSCKSTVFRNSRIDPFYLLTYFNSKYGKECLLRRQRGAIQGGLNKEDLKNVPVPIGSKNQQIEISKIVQKALSLNEKSSSQFDKATDLLNKELGLNDIVFENKKSYTARYSETIKYNRIDSEHFQTKYNNIRLKIKNYSNGYEHLLNNIYSVKPNYNLSQHSEYRINYIELSDINSSLGFIEQIDSIDIRNAPSRAKRIVEKGDVIASSVVGSVDKAGLVSETENGYIASNGFFQFRSNYYSPEFLLILIKSNFIKEQFQQQSTGGILSAVPDPNLKHIIIPKIKIELQNNISELVRESHKSMKESKRLLEQAKLRVEQLIEEAANKQ